MVCSVGDADEDDDDVVPKRLTVNEKGNESESKMYM